MCIVDIMLMNICFWLGIFFYMLCMWFRGWFEIWENEWMSFNCFSKWAREFLQGVQLNLSARSAWLQGSVRDKFCSHFLEECRFGTEAMQGMCRLDKDSELRFWAKEIKTAAAGVRRVERLQHLEVVEELPQGVHVGVFLKTRVVEKSQEVYVGCGAWLSSWYRGPCFQLCLYPMKYLHPRSMYTLPRGGVQRGGTPSAGSGGSIPPAGGSGGKRAPSGGSGVKPPKKKLPCKSIL